jgi:hypothetical protein
MHLELKIAAAIVMAGPVVFWRFEERTPVAKRILKWGSYLGITLLLFLTAGQPWSLAWAAGVPAVGLSYHVGYGHYDLSGWLFFSRDGSWYCGRAGGLVRCSESARVSPRRRRRSTG